MPSALLDASSAEHAANKALLAAFLYAVAAAPEAAIAATLERYCDPACVWQVFHPFDSLANNHAANLSFWRTLKRAFPDWEHRAAFMLGGRYEGRDVVSSLGHIIATFDAPWLGIPPTRGLVFLRFGVNAVVENGRFSKVYILLDIVDLMHQAGVYPFRRMPGSDAQWPFPPCDTGATAAHDPEQGARTWQVVHEMQTALPKPDEIPDLRKSPSRHSHHWHANMNWYGPAGIGSMRGQRGFRDYHGALFLQAFPDRAGYPRVESGPEGAPGHYIRLGDGRFAVTGGWPSLHATHLGGEWLGLPPTGRHVEMRVADWYRVDADHRIVDNWVMMDVPHIVRQMGLDLFHDLQFVVDRAKPRWPEPPA